MTTVVPVSGASGVGGEIMQTRLKIALAAAGVALAAIPAFAVEMPTDGSKNFSPSAAVPSYFTNETLPEPARVDRAASFDEEDVGATTPDVEPDDRHASTHRSARHKSKGHSASAHHTK